jgi:V8-like Glu-specific endopeptidase
MKNLSDRLTQRIAQIEDHDPMLRKELKDIRKMVDRHDEAGKEFSPSAELVAETIVLRTGRPVLAIRYDKPELIFKEEDSEVWKDRLSKAGSYLERAIHAVGRIEVQYHPRYEWIGAGWLVADNTVVTNRHVAMEFGRRKGQRFVFRQGVGGLRIKASIDFLQEFDRAESFEFSFDRILHIEDEEGPDMAFIQVKPVSGKTLAQPIELDGAVAAEDQFVAVIGYPAQDSRVPEQSLMQTIFGDQYNKKRLAPGQVTGIRSDALLHDCSTLGRNSGSVVLSLESGKALGLHFAGRFLEANYAVPARAVAECLDGIRRGDSYPHPSSPQDTREFLDDKDEEDRAVDFALSNATAPPYKSYESWESEHADKNMAQQLAEYLFADRSKSFSLAKEMGVYTSDVEVWIDRFHTQVAILEEVGVKSPCLQFTEQREEIPVPIDIISNLSPWFALQFEKLRWKEVLNHLEDRFSRTRGIRVGLYDRASTLAFFGKRLVEFLSTRVGAQRVIQPGDPNLLRFTVTTTSSGYRVHYASPVWLEWAVFGSPTSPVKDWIEPGTWIFSVEVAGEAAPRIDKAIYNVPPKLSADLSTIA